MEIQAYTATELMALVESPVYRAMPVIPISTIRARAHAANPRLLPTDTIMHIAWQDGVMVGYLGVLADDLYDALGTAHHGGWLSAMWVNPTLRGQGIAKRLLASVMLHWQERILVTEFTPEAKGLYDRSGKFQDWTTRAGLRCFMRFNTHTILPKKKPIWQTLTPLLQIADAVGNIGNDIRLRFLIPKCTQELSTEWRLTNTLDTATADCIARHYKDSVERRDVVDINWMLQYPWIASSPPTAESVRYHFSSVAGLFDTYCYQLLADGVVKAVLIFTLRDGHLRVPYIFCPEDCIPQVAALLYRECHARAASICTVYHESLLHHLRAHPHPFFHLHPIQRSYIITHKLADVLALSQPPILQDGDADCGFT